MQLENSNIEIFAELCTLSMERREIQNLISFDREFNGLTEIIR
jgi:hypothetical protein